MEHQSLWNLYQMRGLIERRHGQWIATDSKNPRHIPWASQYGGPDHIVFGHDSRKGLQVGQPAQASLINSLRCVMERWEKTGWRQTT